MRIYMTRTCERATDGTLRGYGDFLWPEEIGAEVEADDWSDDDRCEGGLFGLRPGQQDPGTWRTGVNAVWMIVSADPADVRDLGGKSKARRVRVEWVCAETDGASAAAVLWLRGRGYHEPIYYGTSISGVYGTSISGDYGTSTSGVRGTSTSGDYGTSTSGDGGASTSGVRGTSTSGDYGTICQWWRDGSRRRLAVAYVGEDGIRPGVPYRVEVVDGAPVWREVAP